MSDTLRIGMIGLDTSHVPSFTKLLNDDSNEHHVPGGKVVVAFPGGSPDFDLSINRVQGFTDELRDTYGVEMVDSPAAVAEKCDVVFIESVDGRVHLEQFKEILPYKLPTYIDKPLAVSSKDANEIYRLADEAGVKVLSCSSLRFDDNLQKAIKADHEQGGIVNVDVYGPMAIQATQPGLYWYGIHTVEVLVAAMGAGCKQVQTDTSEHVDIVTATWDDGRVGVIRGNRNCHSGFGAILHREKGAEFVNLSAPPRPWYAAMLEAVMDSFKGGELAIPPAQSLEIVRLIEAANESRDNGGKVVAL